MIFENAITKRRQGATADDDVTSQAVDIVAWLRVMSGHTKFACSNHIAVHAEVALHGWDMSGRLLLRFINFFLRHMAVVFLAALASHQIVRQEISHSLRTISGFKRANSIWSRKKGREKGGMMTKYAYM